MLDYKQLWGILKSDIRDTPRMVYNYLTDILNKFSPQYAFATTNRGVNNIIPPIVGRIGQQGRGGNHDWGNLDSEEIKALLWREVGYGGDSEKFKEDLNDTNFLKNDYLPLIFRSAAEGIDALTALLVREKDGVKIQIPQKIRDYLVDQKKTLAYILLTFYSQEIRN